ncbi:MAG: hypothetical protein AB7E55_33455 [Pigmentiphaga sp.]
MWSERLADRIAQDDGLGKLSELQLSLLQALRHEFAKHGTFHRYTMYAISSGRVPTVCNTCFPARERLGGWRGCPIPARKPKPIFKATPGAQGCRPDAP